MRLFNRKFLAALLAAALFSSCTTQEQIDAEIKVPVLENGAAVAYKTAVVEEKDIETTANVGGSIGYFYSDDLFLHEQSNVIEIVAKRGDVLKEGDVIAVFDSSSLDYDYNAQKILVDDAYSKYMSTGSEAARLEYEICSKELELIQYKKDQFTIKAPYDCILTSIESYPVGSVVDAGSRVCTVAKDGEIYLYAGEKTDLFKVGMAVKTKFGTDDTYAARVVMTPGGGSGERPKRGSVNINNGVTFKFEDGELERLLSEVDNVLTAGWATIIVPTVQKYNVLTLPEEAIATFSGTTYCSILNNGFQVRIPVEVSGVYDGLAVIKSGLEEGDEVIY